MSFAMEPEIVTLAWIDSAFVQFPLNIYATKGLALQGAAGRRPALHGTRLCEPQQAGRKGSSPQAQIRKFPLRPAAGRKPALHGTRLCEPQQVGRQGSSPQAQIRKFPLR